MTDVSTGQWIAFGIFAALAAGLLIAMFVSRAKDNRLYAFFTELERSAFLIGGVESLWHDLAPWQQDIVRNTFCDKMAKAHVPMPPDKSMAALDIFITFDARNVRDDASRKKRSALIARRILDYPADAGSCAMAIEHWNTIPAELLEELVVANPRLMLSEVKNDIGKTPPKGRQKILDRLTPEQRAEYGGFLHTLPFEPAEADETTVKV